MLPTLLCAQSISKFTFGFIGDSQVAQTKGAMPITMAEDLGIDVEFYGQSCAYARHYLNTAPVIKKHIGYSNVDDINTKNACDVYPYVLQKKYDYVIIALGHNGTTDLQLLIDDIKAHGSTPILVKMFPIAKKPDMEKAYEGISADIEVDLTDFKIVDGRDGIHPPKDQMILVGHEIARLLGDYFKERGYAIKTTDTSGWQYAKAHHGDSLESIAAQHSLTQADIISMNPHMEGIPFNCELRPNELVRVR